MSEPKAPTLSKAPPADRKFPCPACGARLDFDPHAQKLQCPYCGHTEAIAATDGTVVERDYYDYLDKQAERQTAVVPGHTSESKCTGCGAVVLLDDKVQTDQCPFCTTHLEHRPQSASAMIPPESVLPFAVANQQARARFHAWLASLWFAPTPLRQLAILGRLQGVYVPFWTFDSMTYSRYSGQRGDNYWDTESYTETNAEGRQETKTRRVQRIRWWPAAGEVRHFFDDVLICGSKSVPAHLIEQLPPWELPKLEPFRPDFLSGFLTERYAVDLKVSFERAQAIMADEIRSLCCQDIGGDHQRLDNVSTRHVGVTFKHLLLPMWVAAYRFNDKVYQVVINARTGKVAGDRPWSWWKIAGVVLVVAAVATAAVLAWQYFQR